MKHGLFFALAAAAAIYSSAPEAEACTNVLVTKGASADGSCMISYAADSHQLFGELYYRKAADWKRGTMLDIYVGYFQVSRPDSSGTPYLSDGRKYE